MEWKKMRFGLSKVCALLTALAITLASVSTVFGADVAGNPDIIEYINALNTPLQLTAVDTTDFDYEPYRINGFTGAEVQGDNSKLTEIKQADSIFVTHGETITSPQAEEIPTTLPGVGATNNFASLYPGNILALNDDGKANIISGALENIDQITRSQGNFLTSFGRAFTLEDISPTKNPSQQIKRELYWSQGDSDGDYQGLPRGALGDGDIRFQVFEVSSPQQTAKLLGVGTGALEDLIPEEKWEQIHLGKIRMAAVSYTQYIGYIDFISDRSHPHTLFGKGMNRSVLDNYYHDGAMMVDRVWYGRQILATAELKMPGAPKEVQSDPAAALKALFRGEDPYTNENYKNALNYAEVNAKAIGWDGETWSSILTNRSVNELVRYIETHDEYYNREAEQHLVPVAYNAIALDNLFDDNQAPHFIDYTLNTTMYRTVGTRAYSIKGLKTQTLLGGNLDDYQCSFKTSGIDLDEFKETGIPTVSESYHNMTSQDEINDEPYTIDDIPAYQLYFGYAFDFSKNDGEKIRVDESSDGQRVSYNGFGIHIADSEEDTADTLRHDLSDCTLLLYAENGGGCSVVNDTALSYALYQSTDVLNGKGNPTAASGNTAAISWHYNVAPALNGQVLALVNNKKQSDGVKISLPKKKKVPKMTEGVNRQWGESNKDQPLVFRSDADYQDFLRVEVDDQTIAKSNYNLRKGSILVELKPSYLATLSPGKHTISIISKDGTRGEYAASAEFTITYQRANVPTGISSSINHDLTIALMSFGAAVGLSGVLVVKRRKGHRG